MANHGHVAADGSGRIQYLESVDGQDPAYVGSVEFVNGDTLSDSAPTAYMGEITGAAHYPYFAKISGGTSGTFDQEVNLAQWGLSVTNFTYINVAFARDAVAGSEVTIDNVSLEAVTRPAIVQWGAPGGETDIVTANLWGSTAMTSNYTAGAEINPTVDANYYPNNTGRTPRINGAHSGESETGAGSRYGGNPDTLFWNNQPQDCFGAGANTGNPGNGSTNKVMFLWESENFLDVGGPYELVSLRFEGRMRSADGEGTYRFVMKDADGSFHISQEFTHTDGTDFVAYASDVSGLTWYAYTPFVDGVDTIGAVTSPELDRFKGIGLYTGTKNDATNWAEQWTRFFQANVKLVDAEGTAILIK